MYLKIIMQCLVVVHGDFIAVAVPSLLSLSLSCAGSRCGWADVGAAISAADSDAAISLSLLNPLVGTCVLSEPNCLQ